MKPKVLRRRRYPIPVALRARFAFREYAVVCFLLYSLRLALSARTSQPPARATVATRSTLSLGLYWINSDEAVGRRKSMEARLALVQRRGLVESIERVRAWNSREVRSAIDHGDVRLFNISAVEDSTDKDADHRNSRYTLGELGCLLSHVAAVQNAKATGFEYVLVTEDDVRLDAQFFSELSVLVGRMPTGWETIQLTTNNPTPYARFARMKHATPISWIPQHWSTAAILYSRQGLRSVEKAFVRDSVYIVGKGGVVVADEAIYYRTVSFSYFSPFVSLVDVGSTSLQTSVSSKVLDSRQRDLERTNKQLRQVSRSLTNDLLCEPMMILMFTKISGKDLSPLREAVETAVILSDICAVWKIYATIQVNSLDDEKMIQDDLLSLEKKVTQTHVYVGVEELLSVSNSVIRHMYDVESVLLIGPGISLRGFPLDEFFHLSSKAVITGSLRQSIRRTLFSYLAENVNTYVDYHENNWWDTISAPEAFPFDHIGISLTIMNGKFAGWYFEKMAESLAKYSATAHSYFPLPVLETCWCGAAAMWREDAWLNIDEILLPCQQTLLTTITTASETKSHRTLTEKFQDVQNQYVTLLSETLLLKEWKKSLLQHTHLWGSDMVPSKTFQQTMAKLWSEQRTSDDLLVATISRNETRCKRGISPGKEWCTSPVFDERGVCDLEWDELVNMFSLKHQVVLNSDAWWRQEFKNNAALSREPVIAANIYSAHINALQSLCSRAENNDGAYGLVLEDDAGVELFHELSDRLRTDLVALLRQFPEVTNFNLSPSQGLCTIHATGRVSALKLGYLFARHEFESWGAIAIAYNLRRACSERFLRTQERIKNCVPSDVGLYSGFGGHITLDATLPFFLVEDGRIASSSHSADGIHSELKKTNAHVRSVWRAITELSKNNSRTVESGVSVGCLS